MKSKYFFQLGCLLLLIVASAGCSNRKPADLLQGGATTIYASPELYELAEKWAGIYNTKVAGEEIAVAPFSGSYLAGNQRGKENLIFLSGDDIYIREDNSLWKVPVGREIVVPIINPSNPLIENIRRTGVSPASLTRLISQRDRATWGDLLGTGDKEPAMIYISDGAGIQERLSKLDADEKVHINSSFLIPPAEMIDAVKEDPSAIGICRITEIINPGNGKIIQGLELLPIDVNGNGYLDYKENVYADLEAFYRGVWIGKYPRILSNNLYTVSGKIPVGKAELTFLKWIVSGGQALLDDMGYSSLERHEQVVQAGLIESLLSPKPKNIPGNLPGNMDRVPYSVPLTVTLAIFLGILLLVILFMTWVRIFENRKEGVMEPAFVPRGALSEESITCPAGLFFDKTHTWAFMDKDGSVKVGIDDFLQRVTGPLTKVKLKSPGTNIRKGKQVVSIIQEGKQLDISSPVSGIIREQNAAILRNTSLINDSPYADGWIYRIEPVNWLKEVQFYIMGKAYRDWLKSELTRLKEFLSDKLRQGSVEYAYVLQDGGELKEGILEDLGPEVWDDFQTNFMDLSS